MAIERSNQVDPKAKTGQERSSNPGLDNVKTQAADSVLQKERQQAKGDDRLQSLLKAPEREAKRPPQKDPALKVSLQNNHLNVQRARQNVPHVGFIARQLQRSEFSRARRPRSERQRDSRKEPKIGGETRQHELQEQLAIRAADRRLLNQTEQKQTAAERKESDPWTARETVDKEKLDKLPGAVRQGRQRGQLEGPLVGSLGAQSGAALEGRGGSDASRSALHGPGNAVEPAPRDGPQVSPGQAVRLEEIVGPEAALTFREKLQQVWGILEEGASGELDVIARMPVTLSGANAVELLAVESPQGVYFVAFLRNKNDFDLLEPFDRHSLLPGNPSRHLIEAAIIAYEQLETVFREGSEKIGSQMGKLSGLRAAEDPALVFLRQRWLFAKRRRRRFERIIDNLLGLLDEYDLREAPAEGSKMRSDDFEGIENEFEDEEESGARVVELAGHAAARSKLRKAG